MKLQKFKKPLLAALGAGLLSATAQTTTNTATARAPETKVEIEVVASPVTQSNRPRPTARTARSWDATSLSA